MRSLRVRMSPVGIISTILVYDTNAFTNIFLKSGFVRRLSYVRFVSLKRVPFRSVMHYTTRTTRMIFDAVGRKPIHDIDVITTRALTLLLH